MQRDELFFQLLRLSLGQTVEIAATPDDEEWQWLHQTATRQSLLGVLWLGIQRLAQEQQPPMTLSLQWASEAERISGLNQLLNTEAARLTQLFAQLGRRTAILKGQANARLYPEPQSRQPGDIDIWVEGGRESVLTMLTELGMMPDDQELATSYHHVHLSPTEDGVTVEIHFRPSSGNFNPMTNRRLQRWLEKEIADTIPSSTGDGEFNSPSVRFALVMQLAHIQRHFLASGVGLRQVCDYYYLLQTATADDRHFVAKNLRRFGLRNIGGALMWVLGETLHLDKALRQHLCSHRQLWLFCPQLAARPVATFPVQQAPTAEADAIRRQGNDVG